MDRDGRIDTWASYYFTGALWRVSHDRNGDGVPDYREYVKDGIVYKREVDRNFDGKADFMTVVFTDQKRGGEAG